MKFRNVVLHLEYQNAVLFYMKITNCHGDCHGRTV